MAVTSEVQICNNALLRIGASTITSLTDGTTISNACNQAYSVARDALLRSHFWNFTLTRTSLAADVTTPAFEFSTQYTLPADFIRIKTIHNQTSPYKIEQTKLLTNQSAPLNIIYIKQVTDVAKFDPLFVEALILLIVIKVGNRVAGDGFNVGPFQQELQQTLLRAQMVDAQDGSPDQLEMSFFNDARYANSYWDF
jgi:hypothetical protein